MTAAIHLYLSTADSILAMTLVRQSVFYLLSLWHLLELFKKNLKSITPRSFRSNLNRFMMKRQVNRRILLSTQF